VDIKKIADLDHIEERDGLIIGATAKLGAVERYCASRPDYRCFYDALHAIGKIQVMNMGTVAGNLCTASPAADSAPALLVLDAAVVLAGANGRRTVALKHFFKGPRQTDKAPQEIMIHIRVPAPAPASGGAFTKLARVGSDISKITCAVFLTRQGGRLKKIRVAMGSVAPTPIRIRFVERQLADQSVDAALIADVRRHVADHIQPLNDVRSTAAYRRQVAGVLFEDTFKKAWERAGGKTL